MLTFLYFSFLLSYIYKMLIHITKKHVFYSIFSKRKNDPLGSTRLYCQTSDYIIFDITVLVILYLLKHEYV